MPTPSEPSIPPTSYTELSTRTSFSGCPPEEERELEIPQRAPRRRLTPEHSENEAESDCEEHAIAQPPTPEPEPVSRRDGPIDVERQSIKEIEHVEDISIATETASSAATPESSAEHEAHNDELEPCAAEYLLLPGMRPRRNMNATSSFLHSGSRFHGTQRSDRQVYDVQVEIKDVNLEESFLCGYLRIQGLTDDHPTLTTFFEGEIIGQKHRFKTTHPSWGVTEKTDYQHWAKFPAYRHLAKYAQSPNFVLKNNLQREHLFMRWKEYFLVPDHRVKTITGASFEGFYYICFNQCNGTVSGIYFHSKSEKYQRLELQHVEDHGCVSAIEMR